MKILIFTEGTLTMHKNAAGHTREEIIRQVTSKEPSVHDYTNYLPIGNAVQKLKSWNKQGAEILYLTSRRTPEEIADVRDTLKNFGFPHGKLFFRKEGESYKDVAERVVPDVLIEDDCESIGGAKEMTITYVKHEIKKRITSIVVPEFGGIDHLPESINDLRDF